MRQFIQSSEGALLDEHYPAGLLTLSLPTVRGYVATFWTRRRVQLWRAAGNDDADGMLLRPAAQGDEIEVAEVHVRSWQVAYRGLLPDEYLNALDPADRAARYTFADGDPGRPHTTVAVDHRQICGFATIGACRDLDKPGAGELYAIYVHPDWWGRGAGRMLIEEARRHLIDRGFEEAVLWVLAGNARAESFYRIDAWRPDGERRLEEVHGIRVDEIRYVRRFS